MRKTKIICTLGPSTDDTAVLKEMILSGMNAARFNFSHSDHEGHLERLDNLIRLREELNLPVATLLDTKGPEIRIGSFKEYKVSLNKGQKFILTTQQIEGRNTGVSVSYKNLPNDVKAGDRILIDDGLIEMQVEEITDTDITCTVLNDGVLSDNKGVNIPGASLSMPYISEKDKKDIIFAVEKDFDYIACSFARSAKDINQVRNILKEQRCYDMKIIAKIENLEGVKNIDEIIRVSDGIMIARGDMGVEIPNEDVPVIQKMIIKKACRAGKQVITATQMLDSMINNPRPTRAETTDVANAIYDGTSAIMLSGETANGKYPLEALQTMVKIAVRTEQDIDYDKRFLLMDRTENPDVTDAISHATCTTALHLGAKLIITVTKSGRTARMITRYRPYCPIVGCTTELRVWRQMNLFWGTIPVLIEEKKDTHELIDYAVERVANLGYLKKGELTVVTAGVPLGVSGKTNMIKVQVAK